MLSRIVNFYTAWNIPIPYTVYICFTNKMMVSSCMHNECTVNSVQVYNSLKCQGVTQQMNNTFYQQV